jgi:hypothetical protein
MGNDSSGEFGVGGGPNGTELPNGLMGMTVNGMPLMTIASDPPLVDNNFPIITTAAEMVEVTSNFSIGGRVYHNRISDFREWHLSSRVFGG